MPPLSDTASTRGMKPSVYVQMRRLEDTHWWFRGLRALVVEEASEALYGRSGVRTLDVGCGTGGTVAAIQKLGLVQSLFAIDVSVVALAFSRDRRAASVVGGEAERLPFADSTFDLVTVLDVLSEEGVDEDRTLSELARVLKPGGTLLVNLPAFRWLRGSHDAAVDTVRRYTKRSVSKLIRRAGLMVHRMTYWNVALVAVLAVWRPMSRLVPTGHPRSDIRPVTPVLNACLVRLVAGELRLRRWVCLPWGSSIFVVVKRQPPRHCSLT
jgi:SAM-dependent methyltransferase